jgi:large subunit ribosomal protein L9
MEIILKQDIDRLGHKNDLVTVKDGYARNYLIPKGMAILATPSNKKVLAEVKKQQAYKEEKLRKEAQAIADILKGLEVKIGVKAGASGKIFGSVNTIMVADAIKQAKNVEVDRKKIILNEDHIKEVGKYKAQVKLYKDIVVDVDLDVVAE